VSIARDKANSTVSNFASTGIDDNADANSITINSSENLGIGTSTITNTSNYRNIHIEGTNGTIMRFMANGTQVGQIQADTNEFQLNAITSDPMVFKTNNTERMRLLSSGGLTFNGDTAAANALDDYEEGTFTPNFTGSSGGEASYSSREGSYTKIGRLVVAHIRMEISGKGSMSGSVQINNLPFTVANLLSTTSVEASGSVSFYAGMSTSVSSMSTFPMASTTNSQFHMQSGTSGTVMSSINVGDIDTDFNFRATVTYFTT